MIRSGHSPRSASGRLTRLTSIGALAVLILMILSLAGVRPAAAQGPAAYYAPKHKQLLRQPFLQSWAYGGNFAFFGEPVSGQLTLEKRTAQYFEYGAMDVATKDVKKSNAKVTRLPVGAELLALEGGAADLVAGRRAGGRLLPEPFATVQAGTHAVAIPFKTYYNENGGAKRFGKPLSENYLDGGAQIQWFEYGRLEIAHGSHRVHVAPVGLELASRLGLVSAPKKRGDLPVLDTKRFHAYIGDGTVAEASKQFSPTRIMIPSIGIDAAIEQVAITNGVMGTPANAWNVGWYPQLSSPGEWTNVVMAAHRDWWGIGPTIFYNLDQVQPGDKVYLVGSDGKGATYLVTDSYQVGADANPNDIVTDSGMETLTLITCDGSFDGQEYATRRIVRAQRI
jgi:LPXTG-site transpeptidase (sortase) family protein